MASLPHNWLILDKPLGLTSTQALSRAKRLFGVKKAGHAGTLDPLASGILPIAFNEATKTIPFVQDRDKEYVFTVQWGTATDTDDAEGKIIAVSDVRPTRQQILDALPSFIGEIEQIPPRYAAIKIDGQRAYDLARQGADFEMKTRRVRIDALELMEEPPLPLREGSNPQSGFGGGPGPHPKFAPQILASPVKEEVNPDHATFRVACGKGTYVRSIARDLAVRLGTVGHVSYLRRTKVGKFSEKEAISLDFLERLPYEECAKALLPFATALDDIPVLAVTVSEALKLRQGQTVLIDKALPPAPFFQIISDNQVAGLATANNNLIKPLRIFNL